MLRFVYLIRTRVLSMAVFFIILLDITLEWEVNMNQRFLDVLLSNSTMLAPSQIFTVLHRFPTSRGGVGAFYD